MTYLLDTNAWATYLNRSNSSVAKKVAQIGAGDIRLCSIVKAELYFGAEKSARRNANVQLLTQLFAAFASVPFGDAAAECYGRIRADLSKAGTPIGPNDLLIAATAVAEQCTLVTHNVREFSRVPGLIIEDWEAMP
jgi:tRNA(fMet)-specific endonuclease VapC